MSRHRQNRGAVGQVTRAMVVASPLLWMVILLISAAVSGVAQTWQSPFPASSEQERLEGAAVLRMVVLMRSVIFGRSIWPSVATKMVLSDLLTVTASSAGSSASASVTERARHFKPPEVEPPFADC